MVVTLSGDVISHADINLKLPRPAVGKDLYSNTSIREDAPWQLQQVQDSVNHLRLKKNYVDKIWHLPYVEISNFNVDKY